jgi:hypothetical protein
MYCWEAQIKYNNIGRALIGEMRNVYKILVGKCEGKEITCQN